ncbi:hypothetical protein NUM3379_17400 [Kineococcus sp. NUM-3379]
MPKPYPREYRDDVVRVARNRDPDVTLEQIAADFGIHVVTLSKWMRQADVDAGVKPGASTSEGAELREARRRIKLLDSPTLRAGGAPRRTRCCAGRRPTSRRRTCREKALPAREGAGHRGHSGGSHVSGAGDRSPALLPLAAPAGHPG